MRVISRISLLLFTMLCCKNEAPLSLVKKVYVSRGPLEIVNFEIDSKGAFWISGDFLENVSAYGEYNKVATGNVRNNEVDKLFNYFSKYHDDILKLEEDVQDEQVAMNSLYMLIEYEDTIKGFYCYESNLHLFEEVWEMADSLRHTENLIIINKKHTYPTQKKIELPPR